MDPATHLPTELVSLIFLRCLDTKPSPHSHRPWSLVLTHPDNAPTEYVFPSNTQAPLVLLFVCRAWRDICLATPTLWNSLGVSGYRNSRLSESTWLSRGAALPVDISTKLILQGPVLDLLRPRLGQLRSLELYIDNPDNSGALAAVGPFPNLETLSIQGYGSGGWGFSRFRLPVHSVIRLLRSSPNLRVSTFVDIGGWQTAADIHLLHPNLTHFTLALHSHKTLPPFGDLPLPSPGNLQLLDHLTLPALRAFHIYPRILSPTSKAHESPILRFLQRSKPPLESLAVGKTIDRLCLPVVPEMMLLGTIYPHLTHLALTMQSAARFPDLGLLDGLDTLFPKLQSVALGYDKTAFPIPAGQLPYFFDPLWRCVDLKTLIISWDAADHDVLAGYIRQVDILPTLRRSPERVAIHVGLWPGTNIFTRVGIAGNI
uniref:F-box domain-containing protein n=1 Tax=Mycena chlorophos TaxID=658473 RepID=A0ABQ0LQX3_MYCCL|nr:predicted protein [Mycena chlorophos]